jgi:hypothetical protein
MKPPVLSPAVLDGLRRVGDPRWTAPPISAADMARESQPGYQASLARRTAKLKKGRFEKGTVEAAAMAEADAYLFHVRGAYGASPGPMIARARELFVRYGDEISAALLLCALPESYAAEWGAPVLIAHGDLVWQLPRRIRQTALFLIGVLTDAGPDVVTTTACRAHPKRAARARSTKYGKGGAPVINPESTLFQQCVWLRRFHADIRGHLIRGPRPPAWTTRSAPKSVPLNQEDLLATLLTFSVTTFRVLEAFGIEVDDDDREAYLFLWNLVGACLGVGTPAVGDVLRKRAKRKRTKKLARQIPGDWFLPDTVGKADRLLDQLQARQWIAVQRTLDAGRPFPWTDLVPGRTLVTSLLDGLVDAMPPSRQAWPAVVMRELVPQPVQSRLGLQRTGMVGLAGYALEGVRGGTQIRGAALRLMANDVTRHAMQRFLQADAPSPFRIPGLDLSQLTPVGRGSPYELRSR